jgi:hypothetical protein
MILEMTEWRWTINDILAQPEPELWAVMSLKSVGEKYRTQALKRKRNPDGGETI